MCGAKEARAPRPAGINGCTIVASAIPVWREALQQVPGRTGEGCGVKLSPGPTGRTGRSVLACRRAQPCRSPGSSSRWTWTSCDGQQTAAGGSSMAKVGSEAETTTAAATSTATVACRLPPKCVCTCATAAPGADLKIQAALVSGWHPQRCSLVVSSQQSDTPSPSPRSSRLALTEYACHRGTRCTACMQKGHELPADPLQLWQQSQQ